MDATWKASVGAAFARVRGDIGCPMPPCPRRLVSEGASDTQRLRYWPWPGTAASAARFRSTFLQNPLTVAADYFSITRLDSDEENQLRAIGEMPDTTRSSLESAMESAQGRLMCPMPPCPEALVRERSAE